MVSAILVLPAVLLQVLVPFVALVVRPLLVLLPAFVLLVHRLPFLRRPSIATLKAFTVAHLSQNPVPILRQCTADLIPLHLDRPTVLVQQLRAVLH